jgi:hypothetical protein
MLFLNYAYGKFKSPASKIPMPLLVVGLVRTVACAGWVYVTSTDDHDLHDVAMITYLVLTLPYMVMTIQLSNAIGGKETNRWANAWRKRILITFLLNIIPLVYFYIRHQVDHVAGAYSTYAYFEWALVLYDVGFDALSFSDLTHLGLNVVDLGPDGQDVPLWCVTVQDKPHLMRV